MYYSQQQEDVFLHEKYLNYPYGFFIELGGMNGVTFSNTLFFEESLSWTGVLIEPTDQFFEMEKNRPNCHNFNFAVSENEGEIEFLGNGAVGGIKNSLPEQHIKGWGLDNEESRKVISKPLSKILETIKIDMVDLFSIDVEGGELEVLKSFDWSIPVYLVLIEIAKFDLSKDEECRDFLTTKGFKFESTIGCNEIWINEKNIRK